MAIHLPQHDLTFVTVPKVACTSIKCFFFEIDTGRPVHDQVGEGRVPDIHPHFPCTLMKHVTNTARAAKVRLAAVRDPLRRLVSCYEDKIMARNLLAHKPIPEGMRGSLNLMPSFEEFVAKLETYQAASGVIRQHSRSQIDFLGSDLSWYRRIYSVSELSELEADVQSCTGSNAQLPHANKAAKRLAPGDITNAIRTTVERIFAKDYDLFGDILKPSVTT